ncbi:hypothetical protein ACFE04_023406 [Oxalis oulophora]
MDLVSTIFHQWWFISIALFISFSYFFTKLSKQEKLNFPPHPPKLPFIGNLHQVSQTLHRTFRDLSKKYGPIMFFYFGSLPFLIISSAEVAEEIKRTQEVVFSNRPQTKVVKVLVYDCIDVAFCRYNEYWRYAKKICLNELLGQKSVQASHSMRAEEMAKIIGEIRLSCANGVAKVNMTDIFLKTSCNMISRSTLGQVYERQGDKESFASLARKALRLIGAFCFEDLFPNMRWMDTLTGYNSSLHTTCKALQEFLDEVIEEHRLAKPNKKFKNRDFVDILLQLQQDGSAEFPLTDEHIKAILLDMFIAGTETSATIMEYALAELIKNPNVMNKAQEEVRRVLGNKQEVNEEDVSQMKYINYVIRETLRMHPPVMLPRETMTTTTLRGYHIPAGTKVVINNWAIQRDPLLWENPDEFLPDRYVNREVDLRGTECRYFPFGFGRRICPGVVYASVSAEYALANLLFWFDWKLPEGETVERLDMSDFYDFIIHKRTPLFLVPQPYSPSSVSNGI